MSARIGAGVAELVDAPALGAGGFGRGGSSPSARIAAPSVVRVVRDHAAVHPVRFHRAAFVAATAFVALALASRAHADVNPCVQARFTALRCPDLVMSQPSTTAIDTVYERKVLRSTSSINSVGAGPVELVGRKYAPLLMHARQRIYKAGGGSELFATPAIIRFKLIPGQGGYWKLRDAARLELWSVDAAGTQLKLVRTSPKQHYCLRDLKLTRPALARSPAAEAYPACNQDPGKRTVTLGTSVGWSDIYPFGYYEQYIDVTGLSGRFALVHIVDPENVIFESNETNNASRRFVELPSGKIVR